MTVAVRCAYLDLNEVAGVESSEFRYLPHGEHASAALHDLGL